MTTDVPGGYALLMHSHSASPAITLRHPPDQYNQRPFAALRAANYRALVNFAMRVRSPASAQCPAKRLR